MYGLSNNLEWYDYICCYGFNYYNLILFFFVENEFLFSIYKFRKFFLGDLKYKGERVSFRYLLF